MLLINREVANHIKMEMKNYVRKKTGFKPVLNSTWALSYKVYLLIDMYKYTGVVLLYFHPITLVTLVKDLHTA